MNCLKQPNRLFDVMKIINCIFSKSKAKMKCIIQLFQFTFFMLIRGSRNNRRLHSWRIPGAFREIVFCIC